MNRLAVSLFSWRITKLGMPFWIIPVKSCCNHFFVLVNLHKYFWLGHRLTNKRFITYLNVVLRRSFSCLNFFQVFMPKIWPEAMRSVLSWLKFKTIEVVVIWFDRFSQCFHVTYVCWILQRHFWEQFHSFRRLLFLKVHVLKSLSPFLMIPDCKWSLFTWRQSLWF